ncbi:unnamed protein product, partial [marine sediment metagenome]
LDDGGGHLILIIEPDLGLVRSLQEWTPVLRVWVQATSIGLDAFVDGQQMTAWANSLADGSPLEGAALTLYPGGVTGTTAANGLATLALLGGSDDASGYLIARHGGETAILPESTYWRGRGWQRQEPQDEYRWYVFDDRQMYRPGEEVHVKGWLRLLGMAKGGGDLELPGTSASVSYELFDARGNRLLEDRLNLNPLGGFDTSFTLPETMNLGSASLRFRLVGGRSGAGRQEHSHTIQVQEFRRPEF